MARCAGRNRDSGVALISVLALALTPWEVFAACPVSTIPPLDPRQLSPLSAFMIRVVLEKWIHLLGLELDTAGQAGPCLVPLTAALGRRDMTPQSAQSEDFCWECRTLRLWSPSRGPRGLPYPWCL